MNLNIVEKILARASGQASVKPNDIVEANVDAAMFHDLTGPLTIKAFKEMGGRRVWSSDKVVVIFDHLVPADTARAAGLHKALRDFVKEQCIINFYDVGRGGICHQIMVEKGHAKPGLLIIGADSHTCTYGAVGAFATGVGATDMAAVLITGKIWLRVPEVIHTVLKGRLGSFITPKDVILHVIGRIRCDGAVYKGVTFTGKVAESMSIDGRMTMCNMAVEMGAKTGIVEPDQRTIEYVSARTEDSFTPLGSDVDAQYLDSLEFDLEKLEPQVACPHSVDNVKPISEVGNVEVDQAFIGSCTNGRLEDLRVAAKILEGRRIREGVRTIVIPASQGIYLKAVEEGLIQTFIQSGALVCNPTCGPCLGAHMGLLADGEACVTSSNRNFIGRMGSPNASVYLASPATVAASAITGRITDPRTLMR